MARYLLVLAMGWFAILFLAAAFFILGPRSYQSGFTLILPGAGAASTVNLESLGQASSNAASPFGSHSLSPTENYKRLLQSYRLRGKVAETLGLQIEDVPAPRIQLANQTKLMFVSVRARKPADSKRLADTWLSSFENELAALRDEEQDLREDAYRETLSSFEGAVRETQSRIISFQSEYGLISVDQFEELVAQTETMRTELDRADAEYRVAKSEVSRLSGILGVTADMAADILTLLSDTTFQALMDARAEAETERSELEQMFGPKHPDLLAANEEFAGLSNGLKSRGQMLLGLEDFASIDRIYYTSTGERSSLIGSLVEASVKLAGVAKRREAMSQQLAETENRVERLAVPATELDALLRDHQVAETVFASALARIDTNRTDIFASYPLTQTVETPGLPEAPVNPSKKFVALGTGAGMFLYTIGLALLWIRLPVIRALLKTL
ncbi:MAG: hypothetical protein AAF950_09055 [Pseudomonadota bacterium]